MSKKDRNNENKDTKQKKYTVEELLELGKKYSSVELAPPLYKDEECSGENESQE